MSYPMLLTRCCRLGLVAVLASTLAACAWLPQWAPFGGPSTQPVSEVSDHLIVVQYRQGPRSFQAQVANEAVGVRLVETLGVIDGALVEPPPGMSAVQAAEQLRRQPGVINAEPQVIRR